MTFLAVPGEPTVCGFGTGIAAAKTMTISWLPGAEKAPQAGRREPGRRIAVNRVVIAGDVCAPTVVADASAIFISLGLEVRVIGKSEVIGIEDNGGADSDEWTQPEAVMEAGGIRMGETVGQIVVSGDDVGVELCRGRRSLAVCCQVGSALSRL